MGAYDGAEVCEVIDIFVLSLQWNLPIADIPNSGHALNSGQKVLSQIWQSMLSYLPIADTSK